MDYPFLSQSALANLYCMGVASKKDPRQRVGEPYTMPDIEIRRRCASIILEEALETIAALGFEVGECDLYPRYAPDLSKAIDGACDVKFVCDGLLAAMGVPDVPHMAEVCRANREKFPNGTAIIREDGKYLKPEGWKGPSHDKIIQALSCDENGGRIDLRAISAKLIKQAEDHSNQPNLFE